MPDLTDADLEAMEQRHQGTLDDQERYGLGTRQIDDDIGTLIAALREARRERDEAQLARDLFQRQEADAIRYWQQALAEGRLLREALLEWKFVTQSMGSPDLIDAMEQGYEALNATPLTAAEVERVKRLEKVVAWYMAPRFTEPLSMDGRCQFCGRLRVAVPGESEEKHSPDCDWYAVAKPLYDAAKNAPEERGSDGSISRRAIRA